MGVTGMVVGMNARNKRNDNDVCVNGRRVTGANVIERGRGNETREGAGVEGRSSKRERERERGRSVMYDILEEEWNRSFHLISMNPR
jgi:hypothetical protein